MSVGKPHNHILGVTYLFLLPSTVVLVHRMTAFAEF